MYGDYFEARTFIKLSRAWPAPADCIPISQESFQKKIGPV